MSTIEAIVVFLITWWLVLFMVLPWGVRPPDQPETGHATSAPTKPRLWLKAAVTTVIALVIWGIIYWLASANLITFRGG